MHTRVAIYKVKPHTIDSVIEKAEKGMLPIFREHAGFHSYEVLKVGHDTVISISKWESEGQALGAVSSAAAWVKHNTGDDMISAENHVGTVAFSHRASHHNE